MILHLSAILFIGWGRRSLSGGGVSLSGNLYGMVACGWYASYRKAFLFGKIFNKIFMKMKEIGPKGGVHGTSHLDPAMLLIMIDLGIPDLYQIFRRPLYVLFTPLAVHLPKDEEY